MNNYWNRNYSFLSSTVLEHRYVNVENLRNCSCPDCNNPPWMKYIEVVPEVVSSYFYLMRSNLVLRNLEILCECWRSQIYVCVCSNWVLFNSKGYCWIFFIYSPITDSWCLNNFYILFCTFVNLNVFNILFRFWSNSSYKGWPCSLLCLLLRPSDCSCCDSNGKCSVEYFKMNHTVLINVVTKVRIVFLINSVNDYFLVKWIDW